MSDAEQKNIISGNGDWENELWSLINSSDGINCPLQKSCQYKNNKSICLSRNTEYLELINRYLDNDFLVNPPPATIFPKFTNCIENNRLFMLVRKLAKKQSEQMVAKEIPVSVDIIHNICNGQPIEVRLVPLKSTHGAVWRLKDCWVVHLNGRDSSARRRFTLYHEIFHILVHCNSNPAFKKTLEKRSGDFNEILADFFSVLMILPEDILRYKWLEIKDLKRMAAIFDVPETVMYYGLKYFKLI